MIDQLILDSCDPDQSVVVEACAGSGKTWLLVSKSLPPIFTMYKSAQGIPNNR
jgi:ATP-dependent exoDNAse (exonuclease V) beta subunit